MTNSNSNKFCPSRKVSFTTIFLYTIFFASCFITIFYLHPNHNFRYSNDVKLVNASTATKAQDDESGNSSGTADEQVINSTGVTPSEEAPDVDGQMKVETDSSNTSKDELDFKELTNPTTSTSTTEDDIDLDHSTTAASANEGDQQGLEKVVYLTTNDRVDQGGKSSPIELTDATSSQEKLLEKREEEEQRPTQMVYATTPTDDEAEDSAFTYNDVLTPPDNSTSEERIAWLQERIPRIKVLHSTEKSRWFDERVKQLLDGEGNNTTTKPCTVRVFMTWVGPSKFFGKRELLSLESVFKAHPNGCVVIVSSTMDSKQGQTILKPLLSRGYKVSAVTPDLKQLFSSTPAATWFDDLMAGKVDPGKIAISQHIPDLMRYVLLYKYGGIYLDFDMIVLKDMSGVRNSLGIQEYNETTGTWMSLNGAVLVFDKDHPLLLKFIEEFAAHYDGSDWGQNGPWLISRIVGWITSNNEFNIDFNVLSTMAFYPVHWDFIGQYFEKPKDEERSKWADDQLRKVEAETYAIHLWNKLSRHLKIEEGSIMAKLMEAHCILCQGIYDQR